MARAVFEPNVTIGDLLILAKLSSLVFEEESSKPTADLKAQINASSTRIRNALMRIAKVLGPVEIRGKQRRTQRPSARGRNIGGAAVIANLVIQIAQDPQTDQVRLLTEIQTVCDHLEKSYQSGGFKKTKSGF